MKPTTARVAIILHAAGRTGAVTGLLCRPEVGGARFGGRIKELRDVGCLIENVRERNGSDRYWLRAAPDGLVDEARLRVGGPGPVIELRRLLDGQPAPRVRGVPGTAHGIESPCFCNGCLQRASGDGLDDHLLAEQVPPATAAGRARQLEGHYQLPLLGAAA